MLILKAKDIDTKVTGRSTGHPVRSLRNNLTREYLKLEAAGASFEELEARLRGRHTETEEAIQKRLASTKLELENSKYFDYEVINDSIENAVRKLEEIMK
jgi:guanylate kinase